MSKKTLIILIVVLCLVIGAGVGAYLYLSQIKYKEVSQEEITPSQEETQQEEASQEQTAAESEEEIPLPEYIEEGEAPFRVSGGKVYPKFKSGKWSKRPDFIVGGVDSELEAEIKVEDPDGVTRVWLVLIGHKDDLRKEIELKLTDGDSKLGTWSAKFDIPEEMKRIYWTKFYAKNNKGKEELLDLDWRPGNTCPISPTGNMTFGSCTVSSDETAGTENGQITVTGTVNLSGTAGHPAYMIFWTKVVFSGGKVVLYGSTSSIIIKKGRTDSVHSKAAALCAYPAAGYACSALQDCDYLNYYYQSPSGDSPTGTDNCYYRNYADRYRYCSAGSCAALSCSSYANNYQYGCGTCKYIASSTCTGGTKGSCTNYGAVTGGGTSCGTNKYCRAGVCRDVYIVLDEHNSKSCATVCSENGGRTCNIIGTDGTATNGRWWASMCASLQCANHTIAQDYGAGGCNWVGWVGGGCANTYCGTDPNRHKDAWAYCRCY